MKIMLDMDGVLVDFIKGVEERFKLNLTNPYPCPGKFDCFTHCDLNHLWPQLDEDFYANLPWTKEGRQILEICLSYVSMKDICLLTSCTLHGGSLSGKLKWIQEEIPELSRQFLIGPKKQFACSHDRILIDDADHNISAWWGPKLLVARDWNCSYKYQDNILRDIDYGLSYFTSSN